MVLRSPDDRRGGDRGPRRDMPAPPVSADAAAATNGAATNGAAPDGVQAPVDGSTASPDAAPTGEPTAADAPAATAAEVPVATPAEAPAPAASEAAAAAPAATAVAVEEPARRPPRRPRPSDLAQNGVVGPARPRRLSTDPYASSPRTSPHAEPERGRSAGRALSVPPADPSVEARAPGPPVDRGCSHQRRGAGAGDPGLRIPARERAAGERHGCRRQRPDDHADAACRPGEAPRRRPRRPGGVLPGAGIGPGRYTDQCPALGATGPGARHDGRGEAGERRARTPRPVGA